MRGQLDRQFFQVQNTCHHNQDSNLPSCPRWIRHDICSDRFKFRWQSCRLPGANLMTVCDHRSQQNSWEYEAAKLHLYGCMYSVTNSHPDYLGPGTLAFVLPQQGMKPQRSTTGYTTSPYVSSDHIQPKAFHLRTIIENTRV